MRKNTCSTIVSHTLLLVTVYPCLSPKIIISLLDKVPAVIIMDNYCDLLKGTIGDCLMKMRFCYGLRALCVENNCASFIITSGVMTILEWPNIISGSTFEEYSKLFTIETKIYPQWSLCHSRP